jgi:hypothetical protein
MLGQFHSDVLKKRTAFIFTVMSQFTDSYLWRLRQYVISKRWEAITQPHGVTKHKTCLFNTKTDLQPIKSFSAVPFPVGKAASFPHDFTRNYPRYLLSFAYYTRDQMYGCAGSACLGGEGGSLNEGCWETTLPSLSLSLSFSASLARAHIHTHTHARTRALQTARYGTKYFQSLAF